MNFNFPLAQFIDLQNLDSIEKSGIFFNHILSESLKSVQSGLSIESNIRKILNHELSKIYLKSKSGDNLSEEEKNVFDTISIIFELIESNKALKRRLK